MTLTMPTATTDTSPLMTAVTYQRVSTKEQAAKGGRDEGFSIPAQRKANHGKAADLKAKIVAEFSDPGYSAKTMNRPDLQRMLKYIKTHQVTYCIVHKVDRLARDRLVDLQIHSALIEAGVTLISVTESIDETPSGTLVHGVMSSIAEFYSRNLAAEVSKGLIQKFETGGTPMRAPIGYLNIRKHDEQGREYRTVEIDPERAPLVKWVFEQYATGDHTVVDLLAAVTARGLTTVPTPKRPSGPVARSGFFKLLRNPYYIGIVRYRGAEQTGTHEPLIDIETWQQVQRLLDSRKIASERRRSHDHYLKGSLFCGECGSRMQLDYPANKQGIRYAYYVCSGRASKRKNCTRRAVPVGIAEQLVADCYQDIAITEAEYAALAAQVEAAFDERLASRSQELAELAKNRERLQNESDKLLAAHFADAIDLETLKRHQDRIRTGLADIDRRLANEHDQHEGPRKHLGTALSLLVDCANLYARTDDQGKRLANQALTDGIEIDEDERAAIRLAEPFAALVSAPASADVRSSSTSSIVGDAGLEPTTSSV
ncbi:recombinase family protein [Microbacterium sp. JB110]|uniref:recombinase family protein n=1 Tax=Microbacterium sp. TaxID=51671 RepID=UPI000B3550AA|nr:recombinase family protein [Microbacterium sp. JB110]